MSTTIVNAFQDNNGNVYSGALFDVTTGKSVAAGEALNSDDQYSVELNELDGPTPIPGSDPTITISTMEGQKIAAIDGNTHDGDLIPVLEHEFQGTKFRDLTPDNNKFLFEITGSGKDFASDFHLPVLQA